MKIVSGYTFENLDRFRCYTSVSNKSTILSEARKAIEAYYKPSLDDGSIDKNTYDDYCQYAIVDYEDAIESVEFTLSGTYSVNKAQDTVTYRVSGVEPFSEYFVVNGNKLTFTGSSLGNEGYPITFTKSK